MYFFKSLQILAIVCVLFSCAGPAPRSSTLAIDTCLQDGVVIDIYNDQEGDICQGATITVGVGLSHAAYKIHAEFSIRENIDATGEIKIDRLDNNITLGPKDAISDIKVIPTVVDWHVYTGTTAQAMKLKALNTPVHFKFDGWNYL